MKKEFKLVPESSIESFAEANDLTMQVYERGKDTNPNARYFAHFKDCEVQDGGVLRSAFGNGATPDEAIENYGREISEERIVIGAYTPERREIQVPRILAKR